MQDPLNFHGATDRVQCALELHQERVAYCLHLPPPELGEQRSEEPVVALENVEGYGLVRLGQGGEAHHVGEHDRGQSAWAGGHGNRTVPSHVKYTPTAEGRPIPARRTVPRGASGTACRPEAGLDSPGVRHGPRAVEETQTTCGRAGWNDPTGPFGTPFQ